MKYSRLGSSGLEVSNVCLGTMTWGEQNDQNDTNEQLDYAVAQGVNFIDTAELYPVPATAETSGRTSKIIGNWLQKRGNRDQVIIASKIAGTGDYTAHIRTNGFRKEALHDAITKELKRLQTDYIDLYQLHWPERKTNFFGKLGYEHDDSNEWTRFEDILGNLKKFIDQGKIKHVGVSNETPWGLSKYLELSKDKNLPRMLSVQNPYNLLNRTYEIGLAEMSIREQAGLLAYSPLACGYLSGKYRNKQLPKNSRMERDGDFWSRYNNQNAEKAIELYYEISKKYGLDLAQMSLKFLEIQPFVTSVIIGATTMEQLKTNIESVNINLSDDVIKEINDVQKIYPNPCP